MKVPRKLFGLSQSCPSAPYTCLKRHFQEWHKSKQNTEGVYSRLTATYECACQLQFKLVLTKCHIHFKVSLPISHGVLSRLWFIIMRRFWRETPTQYPCCVETKLILYGTIGCFFLFPYSYKTLLFYPMILFVPRLPILSGILPFV